MDPLLAFDVFCSAHMLVGLHDMRGMVCDLCDVIVKVFVFLRELRG